MILWGCNFNIYYMLLYHAASLHDNPYKLLILVGFGEVCGQFIIERIVRKVKDTSGLIVSFMLICGFSIAIKHFNLDGGILYAVFFATIFSFGAVWNLITII